MINPLKLAQSLIGDSVKLHSVNFFSDFVHVDFSLPEADHKFAKDHVFTGDGDTLEEALDAALDLVTDLKAEIETRKILARLN